MLLPWSRPHEMQWPCCFSYHSCMMQQCCAHAQDSSSGWHLAGLHVSPVLPVLHLNGVHNRYMSKPLLCMHVNQVTCTSNLEHGQVTTHLPCMCVTHRDMSWLQRPLCPFTHEHDQASQQSSLLHLHLTSQQRAAVAIYTNSMCQLLCKPHRTYIMPQSTL